VLATKSITSRLVRKGYNSITYFSVILASYIRILGYLLGYPPNRASLLVLLFLFLRVLLLYFLPLLGLLKALEYLPPIVLTILRLKFLLP
jgi:hypothetical protein